MAEKYTVVGKSLPHIDAKEKVTGRLKFTGDLPALPGMLYAKVLRSPHAHARIKKIDTTKAEALPGVGAVITHKDCPEKELIGSGFNWTSRVLEEKVRFAGDEVAAVAAVDEDTAEKALDLIEVEYEELPAVFTVEEAIKQGAPQILPHSESNAQATDLSEWGNVDKGFKEADFIVEHRTKMGGQAHAPLDRNACIASLEGDRLTVWTSTHSLDVTHMLIVNGMEMPYHKVRVFSPPTGGSFGLHWDNKYMLIPCYLSRKARKPVKLELSREEIMATVKRREMPVTHVKLGVKKDGTLTALYIRHLFDNGAYGAKSNPYQAATDLYRTPNGRAEFIGVATNRCTAGCMRGVGDLTVSFCLEQVMDMAAERLGIDPVEFRIKNCKRTGDIEYTSQPGIISKACFPDRPARVIRVNHSALYKCLSRGAEAIGWAKKWKGWGKPVAVDGSKRRGIGVGAALHVSGVAILGSNGVIVRLNHDGTVQLIIGAGRMGQGADTMHAQITAEVLGIPLDDVTVIAGDSAVCPGAADSVGSTNTGVIARVTKKAAEDAKRQILEQAAIKFGWQYGLKPEELDIKDRKIIIKQRPEGGSEEVLSTLAEFLDYYSLTYETQACPNIVGSVAEGCPYETTSKMSMSHFAEVEVDTETGQVKVLKYVAVHDSGILINPVFCESQVHGGVFLVLGLSLSEDLQFDERTGAIINPNFVDYKVLGALDIPDPEVLFVEEEDPYGPFGAKSIGEGAGCPVPSAVVNAVYNAIGVRIETPITREKVLKAIRGRG